MSAFFVAGGLFAVCSCTVQPLFAGIYRKGAGLGPAVSFLFFAPAGNILALSCSGVALEPEFAFARVALSPCFGVGIGLVMALLFRRDEDARMADAAEFAGGERISRHGTVFLAVLVVLLIAGTLKLVFLKMQLLAQDLAWPAAGDMQARL